jgi:hypothetical protein
MPLPPSELVQSIEQFCDCGIESRGEEVMRIVKSIGINSSMPVTLRSMALTYSQAAREELQVCLSSAATFCILISILVAYFHGILFLVFHWQWA